MKKLFVFLPIIILSACSHFQSKQAKAEAIVKTFLDSTLNDPKSYQSIKFTKIDTLWGGYLKTNSGMQLSQKLELEDDTIKVLQAKQEVLLDALNWNNAAYKKLKKAVDFFISESKADLAKMTDSANVIKGPFIGYEISNTYRAKNGFGALTVHKTKFEIDSNITKVMRSKEDTE